MKTETFHISGPALLTRPIHGDARGSFSETYNAAQFFGAMGFTPYFVQDNLSTSVKVGTLRGLHLQTPPAAQAKLITCISGKILDIIVDARTDSPTFGEHVSAELQCGDGKSLWVPEGFLHGFVTREPNTIVSYKVTAHYDKDCDISVMWNDPDLGLEWSLDSAPILSGKDASGINFKDFDSPFRVTP